MIKRCVRLAAANTAEDCSPRADSRRLCERGLADRASLLPKHGRSSSTGGDTLKRKREEEEEAGEEEGGSDDSDDGGLSDGFWYQSE
jgi:hypothetical protein